MWVVDNSGLAQPGTTEAALNHWLSRCYPRSVLRSAAEELELIKIKYKHANEKTPVFFAHAVETAEDAKRVCFFYAPRFGLCLETMDSVSRRSVAK
jgi:hypothetical protein